MSQQTQPEQWITLAEVWQAYRKAKKEAYYSNTAAYGIRFAKFEDNLIENLSALHQTVLNDEHPWATEITRLGGISYVPKSISPIENAASDPHFRESDPLTEWRRTHRQGRKSEATTRLVIEATVEYQVIATLWSLKVGEKYEASLITPGVYANRLRRRYRPQADDEGDESGPVNWDSHSLFQSFPYHYGRWRRDGIKASKKDIEGGHRVIGITLDVTSFYDCIDASFLLNDAYLNRVEVRLTTQERVFTEALVRSFETWRQQADRTNGIPIGLQCSGLIANLILGPFDHAVVGKLRPTFYGRFVDDIYLSLRAPRTFKDGRTLLNWLVREIPWLVLEDEALRIKLPYAKTSILRFGTKKQRVFQLAGQAGLDVLTSIEEHMRVAASAHRMLPELPESEASIRENALMLSRDASVAGAVFREADFVSLKKAGFSETLSKMERIADILPLTEWKEDRQVFYDLVLRHLMAPAGFFEFFTYIPRVVGLMAVCSDWDVLSEFLDGLSKLRSLLQQTTKLSRMEVVHVYKNLAERTQLAALKCCHQLSDVELDQAVEALKRVRKLGMIETRGDVTGRWLREYGRNLHFSDWARRPYYYEYLESRKRRSSFQLPASVHSVLHFEHIQTCLAAMNIGQLTNGNWAPVVFPTRPIPLASLTSKLSWEQIVGIRLGRPSRLDENQFSHWVLGFRGMRLSKWVKPRPLRGTRGSTVGIVVGSKQSSPLRIAVSNVLTSEPDWLSAAQGYPVLTRDRFARLTRMVNHVISHEPIPDILVIPELALPRPLLYPFVQRLGRSGVSLIAGLEYEVKGNLRLNQSVTTLDLGDGYGQLLIYQTKNAPAWEEALLLKRKAKTALFSPKRPELPIYRSKGFYFGVLICSDLTNPRFRAPYQGQIDSLFVLEWNQDIVYFNSLVEASALDIHAYIVQANNRLYGDGRIRGPLKKEYEKDVIRLKGGAHDYFVVGEIDPRPLRQFQSISPPKVGSKGTFKPYPIGFLIAPWRRIIP